MVGNFFGPIFHALSNSLSKLDSREMDLKFSGSLEAHCFPNGDNFSYFVGG